MNMAVPPQVLAMLAGQAQKKQDRLTNDIAVLHGTTKGKGKKHPGVDYEVHVNPVSIATGAAVLGVGALAASAAMWAGGIGVTRRAGSTDHYTVRKVKEGVPPIVTHHPEVPGVWGPYHIHPPLPGVYTVPERHRELISPAVPAYDTYSEAVPPTWAIYSKRGVPVRYLKDEQPTVANVLSPNQITRGWTVETFEAKDDYYVATVVNATRRSWGLEKRPRFGIDLGLL